MKKAKIVYIDLDDVLADYWGATKCLHTGAVLERRMWDKDFFLNLAVIPGSQGAIFEIMKHGYDVWILSQPLADSPQSYTDKARWVQLHFPQLYKKIILTQDKALHIGDILIDDNQSKWRSKFENNGGTFIHFPYGGYNKDAADSNLNFDPALMWRNISKVLCSQDPYKYS